MEKITIEVSAGELLDKISILRIKRDCIRDPDQRGQVLLELATLESSRDQAIGPSEGLTRLARQLDQINARLWGIEDDIRTCERDGDFGERFVELARAVYRTNDQRSDLKRQINQLLGSRIVEQKQYSEYE